MRKSCITRTVYNAAHIVFLLQVIDSGKTRIHLICLCISREICVAIFRNENISVLCVCDKSCYEYQFQVSIAERTKAAKPIVDQDISVRLYQPVTVWCSGIAAHLKHAPLQWDQLSKTLSKTVDPLIVKNCPHIGIVCGVDAVLMQVFR